MYIFKNDVQWASLTHTHIEWGAYVGAPKIQQSKKSAVKGDIPKKGACELWWNTI